MLKITVVKISGEIFWILCPSRPPWRKHWIWITTARCSRIKWNVLHYWDNCSPDTQTGTAMLHHHMDWKSVSTCKCCYWGSDTWLSVQAVKSTRSSTQCVPLSAASFHPVLLNHAHRRLGSISFPSGPRPRSSARAISHCCCCRSGTSAITELFIS